MKYAIAVTILLLFVPSYGIAAERSFPSELSIYQRANAIAAMGWQPNGKYRIKKNNTICAPSGECYGMPPAKNSAAATRAGGTHADYYGSAVMTKMLTEFILQRSVTFTSGDRPGNIGSSRHHTAGASYAFDLRTSGNLTEKAQIAAAWKFAAQTFGFPASVGMRYSGTPTMVHVDTKNISKSAKSNYQWGSGRVSYAGRKVLAYYGNKNTKTAPRKLPYEVLASVFGVKNAQGLVYTGTLNGQQTYLPALQKVQENGPNAGITTNTFASTMLGESGVYYEPPVSLFDLGTISQAEYEPAAEEYLYIVEIVEVPVGAGGYWQQVYPYAYHALEPTETPAFLIDDTYTDPNKWYFVVDKYPAE